MQQMDYSSTWNYSLYAYGHRFHAVNITFDYDNFATFFSFNLFFDYRYLVTFGAVTLLARGFPVFEFEQLRQNKWAAFQSFTTVAHI